MAERVGDLFWTHLASRVLPDGGFAPAAGDVQSRPDSTAWAAIALTLCAPAEHALLGARTNLADRQREDGGVYIDNPQPLAFWPTALALMAWGLEPRFESAHHRAEAFLLNTDGVHYQKPSTSPMGHDTSLRGWPWAAATHSWVEPTALALLALSVGGNHAHPRCLEATRLLLDRQLPGGGWNYGNTTVYGHQLRPLPCETGIALAALSGRVDSSTVSASLDYLGRELTAVRTPMTLAWGVLGLSGWGRRPPSSSNWLRESWDSPTGEAYTTTELSLLALADAASDGLAFALAAPKVTS